MESLVDKLESGNLTAAGRRAIERRARTMNKMAASQQALHTKLHKKTMLLDITDPDSPTGVVMKMMTRGRTRGLMGALCAAAGISGTDERMATGTPEAQRCWLKVAEGMNRIGVLTTDPTGSSWKSLPAVAGTAGSEPEPEPELEPGSEQSAVAAAGGGISKQVERVPLLVALREWRESILAVGQLREEGRKCAPFAEELSRDIDQVCAAAAVLIGRHRQEQAQSCMAGPSEGASTGAGGNRGNQKKKNHKKNKKKKK
jgi:hypothetical protein